MPRTIVSTDRLMRPIAQFSFGMRAADVVRIGATAGTDAARRMAGSTPGLADAAAQAAQMLDNFATSLDLLGASVSDVVHIRSYLNDWRDLAAYEDALARCWPDCRASHSVIGSAGFPLPQAAVEAEVLAIVSGQARNVEAPGVPRAPAPAASGGLRIGARHFCTVAPCAPGAVPPADTRAQANSMLDHLELALDAAGLQTRDLVMLNLNGADVRDLAAFDAVFAQRLRPPYPARTVAVTSLASPHWLFSLEAVAVAGGGSPIELQGAPSPLASAAVLAGDELFIGGQHGVPGIGATEGVVEQTHRAWSRIEQLLDAAGMDAADVLHTTNMLTDWRSYAPFNAAYGAHVTAPYPPRATVIATPAQPGARVVIEAQAHRAARDGIFIGASNA
jgi:enamine deaminase RidA (YjgF/YER057c/UK114 family)